MMNCCAIAPVARAAQNEVMPNSLIRVAARIRCGSADRLMDLSEKAARESGLADVALQPGTRLRVAPHGDGT